MAIGLPALTAVAQAHETPSGTAESDAVKRVPGTYKGVLE
jgi:hypothetical protein